MMLERKTTSFVISILMLSILVIAIATVTSEEAIQNLTILIDSGGVAHTMFYADLKPGVNTLKLFVDPIAETINIKCNDIALPWILMDNILNIVSNNECRAFVEYLAKIYINETTLSLSIKGDVKAKLIVERNVILLSIPEDIESFSTENDRLIMVFRGPATITYVLSIANATATMTPPTERIQLLPMPVIIGISVAIAIAIVVLVLILRRR